MKLLKTLFSLPPFLYVSGGFFFDVVLGMIFVI